MTQLEALQAIADRDGGLLTPAAVLEEARNPESVLHGAFTWDDTEAARKWRIREAQELIRTYKVHIVQAGQTVQTYAFVGLSTDRTGSSETNPYRRASDVVASEDLLAVAERDALVQLEAVKSRYEHISRLSSVWTAIDEARRSAT